MAMSYACGVCWMMTTGFCLTAALTVVRFLTRAGWPELTIQAGGYIMSCFAVAAYLIVSRKSGPPEGEKRWMLSAGFFMALSMVMLVTSVKLGTPIGDMSSLVSINVVASALLGRLLLGDPLRWVHGVSALCSLVGALLVSRPTILFGQEIQAADTPNTAWLGYLLGPIAGLFDACAIISARKCPSTSEWQIALSYYSQAAILLVILTQVPALEAHPMAKIQASPAEAAMWVGILTVWDLPSMVIYAMAAQALPAALSATVDTASRMVLGFVADVLLFGGELHVLTCTGAVLMLLAVAMTAMVREEQQEHPQSNPSNQQGSAETAEDDVASVASFAASEFVDVEPSKRDLGVIARQLRLRFSKFGKELLLGPVQTFGALSDSVA
mmetsp:Transcript_73384/g.129480  ORF Transcript_73384/g.129480 Transcript_73384/m.129480 type:complete len:384 (-) Transcript_73384:207-1358(-)|eukprot:CAMPEP_0197631990 /NCGR_PEP_ID=MMETSP1338-20131121/8952_1 /TAXON_ID=43686 ORGANISM="Pelagodinium beii, Strain RCC1491" /NCGR_SAMPLE_ID=MMETSP1338 /ASSEMBLY_ACC=CAM_ASM_000754 /LENGTH=383 /DNA_ID=CAMNT_0043203537 /DNA_START=89 /DNA_END=1240 /DNA_ORIENTATION=+